VPAAFAFLHHVAAFALTAALAIEMVLVRGELTARNARTLLVADLTFGASAGAILIVGFLRVLYFEKGASYYFHSIPFIAKLTLFAVIGLLSIYPTVQFLSWRRSVKKGAAPAVPLAKLKTIRLILNCELACLVVLVLCAALMARGIGFMGA